MKRKIRNTIVILLSLLLPVLMGFLAAGYERKGLTDQTIIGLWESEENESSLEASLAALMEESLRQRAQEESLSRERAESILAEASIAESVRHSLWVRESLEQSAAESIAYEQSVAASLAYEQYLAASRAHEQSVAEALEAYLAESEEEERLLPCAVGNTSYIEMASECYYVDKTLLIRDLIDDHNKVTLFTRPRRFGKTLAINMLKTYFEKTEEDTSRYFAGREIWQCGYKYRSLQGKYPGAWLLYSK